MVNDNDMKNESNDNIDSNNNSKNKTSNKKVEENKETNKNEKPTLKSKIFKKSKKDEIKELTEELNEKKSDYLRLLADFQNYRKRMQKEVEDARDYGKISLIESLLPVLDNLEASLKMKDSNPEMVVKGIDMILKNLFTLLEEHHVKTYEPKLLEDFDPKIHDPLLVEDENEEVGKVLAVVSKGFKYKDKVIRASKVKVKKEEE